MRSFTTENLGRMVFIHLGKGELLLENIEKELQRLGIQSGVLVSGIGSLRKMVMHVIASTNDNPDNEFLTVEAPLEISAIQGLIVNGEPHFHITCSEPGNVYIGHLEPGCEVQYLVEIGILEVKDLDLERKADEFGISYLDMKS